MRAQGDSTPRRQIGGSGILDIFSLLWHSFPLLSTSADLLLTVRTSSFPSREVNGQCNNPDPISSPASFITLKTTLHPP